MRDPLILRFFILWVAFLCFEALIPITGKYADPVITTYVYIYIYAFLIAVLIGVLAGSTIQLKLKRRPINYNRVISLLSYLTILGAIFVAYNRIIVQGIDYTQGIAIAREQWKQASVNVGTSLFGPIGNLLLSGFLYVHVLLIIWKTRLTRKNVYLSLFAGFMGLVSEMIFTGGRSFLLIYIAAIYIAMLTRKTLKMSPIINPVFFISFLAIGFLYAGHVFQLRANMGGFSAAEYTMSWIDLLGGEKYPDIPNWLDFPITHLSILVISYLIHSIWEFEQVIALDLHDNYAILTFIRFIGFKVGIFPESAPWELSGYFIPLPGLVFHDFGLIAIAPAGFLLGFIYSISRNIFLYSNSIGSLLFYTLVSVILILSPIGFAFDLMLFFYLSLYLLILKTVRLF